MTPGSIQFRKHCQRILPQRGGEQKAQYIARLARHFGFTNARMTVLYYDSRKDNARFTTTEYQTISGSTPIHIQDKRLNENSELREELREIKQYLRARDEKLKFVLQELLG